MIEQSLPLFASVKEKVVDSRPADWRARERALDPAVSFIVQAPAGSGKTELLTRRILALLATVEEPEEVLAITFTRKAAAEMRARVVSALVEAGEGAEGERAELARAALARSRQRGWELEKNPSRLWVSTIDAFNHHLAGRMPWLSRLGGSPSVTRDAPELYDEAANLAFTHLREEDVYADAVERVLSHLDNNAAAFKRLVAALLGRRDQWLRRRKELGDPDELRPELEGALAELVGSVVEEAAARLSPHARILEGLFAYAGANVEDSNPIAVLRELGALPEATVVELERWRALATLLLTAKGDVRKSVTVKQGFPPGKGEAADYKERMKYALEALREDGEAQLALANLLLLPDAVYDDPQWEIIAPIVRVVDLAVACLWEVMSRRRECDFGEVAERGLKALGEAGVDGVVPSELLLALDRRLSHILVDEFQDTSHMQFALLERLTEGWERGDGRTLFLVGDPMQSIYRFRESEVGLFFRAAHEGVGLVALEPLSLTVNFRSDGAVIDWVNDTFAEVFPAHDDPATGAVSYSHCVAFYSDRGVADEGGAVRISPLAEGEARREAAEVVEEALRYRSEGSVAILVRSRTYLAPIVEELAQRDISYRGEELDELKERAAVKDIRSLMDALFNPGDRLAWLAVLRAPWCGLTLGELLALVGGDARPVMQILGDALEGDASSRLDNLSEEGRAALNRTWPVLKAGRAEAGRAELRELVEGVWCALGAPGYLSEGQLADAEALFEVLEELDVAGGPIEPRKLDRTIAGLYARPDPSGDPSLSVMTIHKSKGLEFDTVLLPGLGHRPPPERGGLIDWAELPSGGLVIGAPPPRMVGAKSPVRDFIRELDKQKGLNERIRLLYVAATRAKSRLVLWGTAKVDGDGEVSPASGSMLSLLWPRVENLYEGLAPAQEVELEAEGALTVEHLPAGWSAPPVIDPPIAQAVEGMEASDDEEELVYDWAREERKLIGTMTHLMIERISHEGPERWSAGRLEEFRPLLSRKLAALGVGEESLASAAQEVVAAATAMLEDERGRWIVSRHEGAASELELGGLVDGRVERRTVDRTFIDENGVRWIVDYKVTPHKGGDIDLFLSEQTKRYRGQLERYVTLMRFREPGREVRAALYFPLQRRFVEVGEVGGEVT